MPVPKSTKPTETVEPDAVEEPTPAPAAELDSTVLEPATYEPHDFEVRRAALELAITARETDPVEAARGYYGFLAGDKPAEATA